MISSSGCQAVVSPSNGSALVSPAELSEPSQRPKMLPMASSRMLKCASVISFLMYLLT